MGRAWSREDYCHLFAYLDWCLGGSEEFDNTVVHYLSPVLGRSLTLYKLKKRLRDECTRLARAPGVSNRILTQGTAILNLPDNERDRIQEIIAEIKRSKNNLGDEDNLTTTRVLAPKPSHDDSFDMEDTIECIGQESPAAHSATVQSATQINHDTSSLDIDEPSMTFLSYTASKMEHPEPVEEPTDSPPCASAKSSTSHKRLKLISRPQSPNESTEHLSSSQTLRQTQTKFTPGPTQAVDALSSHREQDMQDLRAQIQSLQQTVQGVIRLGHDELSQPKPKTVRDFNMLFKDVSDISHAICNLDPSDQSVHVTELPLLQRCSRRVSGLSMPDLVKACEMEGVQKHEVLSSLFMAAIFELIMEPIVSDLFPPPPLVESYRHQMLQRDGAFALQQMDFLAFKSFTTTEHFRTVMMPQKVHELRVCFLSSFLACMPADASELHKQEPRNAGEGAIVAALDNALHQALNIKINLSLYVVGFQFHYFQRGDSFTPTYMQLSHQSPARAAAESKAEQRIKLCAVPAMFASTYSEAGGSGLNMMPNSLLAYNRILSTTVHGDLAALGRVAEAIVIM